MISLEKLMILQRLPNNEGDLGKIIVATSYECMPKKQKIAQSGHIDARGSGLRGDVNVGIYF